MLRKNEHDNGLRDDGERMLQLFQRAAFSMMFPRQKGHRICGPRSCSLRRRPSRLSPILTLLFGVVFLTSHSFAEEVADSRMHIGDAPRVFAQNATTRVPNFRRSIESNVRQRAPGATTRGTDVTAVPDFRRHTVVEARRMAQNAGLGLEQGNVGIRDEGRALVVTQAPTAGTLVRRGSIVKVIAEIRGSPVTIPEFPVHVLPVKPPLRSAPNLIKETLHAARRIAANEGFVVGVEGVDPADERGAIIIAQAPTAGTRLPPKSTIRVKVREAFPPPPDTPPVPEPPPQGRYVPVPNLMNRTLLDARRLIASADLTLAASRFPPGEEDQRIVVGQKPLPKTLVPIGTRISVRIASDSSTGWPPNTTVVPPPTTPPGPPTTVPPAEPFEPPMSTLPPIRMPPPDPRAVKPRLPVPGPHQAPARVPALIETTPRQSERLLPARGLTPRLSGWVVIAIVATAVAIAAGAGMVLAMRARAKAGLRAAETPPDLRIVVSGDGWQQEEPPDSPILDSPTLRLRVRSESRVEPVDADFPIVAEEVRRHGE